jgi:hypothetical protein
MPPGPHDPIDDVPSEKRPPRLSRSKTAITSRISTTTSTAPFYTSTDLFGIAANGVLGHENTLRPPFERIGGGLVKVNLNLRFMERG